MRSRCLDKKKFHSFWNLSFYGFNTSLEFKSIFFHYIKLIIEGLKYHNMLASRIRGRLLIAKHAL